MSENKFEISLRENGEHSFKRSLEAYEEYEKTKDQMLLKDTIMFLHQSIELLMKEVLVAHSPYLIFEDLKDIPRKQKEANTKGIPIFFIDKPPRSVTYEVAVERVEAFLNPPELNDALKENLDRLNRLRNQLEHYAINADRDEVVQVLDAVQKPILAFFEKNLGPLPQLHSKNVTEAISHIEKTYKESSRLHHEVYELLKGFNGQRIPGYLLGVDGEITLPRFIKIENEFPVNLGTKGGRHHRVDIFAEAQDASDGGKPIRWLVEVKGYLFDLEFLSQLKAYSDAIENSRPWLVTFTEIAPRIRTTAKQLGIMVTGRDEYMELIKIISSTVHS